MSQQPTKSASLPLLATITVAWKMAYEHKKTVWLTFLVLIAINFLVKFLLGFTYNLFATHPIDFNSQIPLHLLAVYQVIAGFISAPFYTGIILAGVKLCRGQSITISSGFDCIRRYLPLGFTGACIALVASSANIVAFTIFRFTHIHSMLLPIGTTTVYPLIIFSFMVLALPGIIDQQLPVHKSVWQSILHMSRAFNWLKVLLCYIVMLAILALFIVPLGYGLLINRPSIMLLSTAMLTLCIIWLVPFMFMFNANVYQHLNPTSSSIPA